MDIIMTGNRQLILKHVYRILLATILSIIVLTPFIVKRFGSLNEEYAEIAILVLMLPLAFFTNRLYREKSREYEQSIERLKTDKETLASRLDDSFRYIGSLNVQVQELESLFTKIDKYPETKQEIRKIHHYLAEKILSLVNAEWVALRIIDEEKLRTLSEVHEWRGGKKGAVPPIANKDLINRSPLKGYTVVTSTDETFSINSYCIIPGSVDKRTRRLIEAVVNQAEMLYIIYSSAYYRSRSRENFQDE